MTKKEFVNVIFNMEFGERVYINSLGLKPSAIEFLRFCIKNNILKPVEEELRKCIKEEYIDRFMSGDSIFPQMDYYKVP